MDIYILQCPKCHFVWQWTRSDAGPGKCSCGAWAPWKVLKAMPEPGHVIVYSSKGKQQLHAPNFTEDPNAWDPTEDPSDE